MLQVPKIVTENSVITLLKPEQAALIQAFYSRNEAFFRPWFPSRDPEFFSLTYWQKRLDAAYEEFLADRSIYFVSLTKDETEVLAVANFSSVIEGAFKGCFLHFALDHQHQGQGLMYTTLCNTLNYVFCELDLHRVMSSCPLNNLRAQNLLKQLGFEQEGVMRSYLKINGQWQDHSLNSLLNPLHHCG